MSEIQRYVPGTTNDYDEAYCKCAPCLLPDKDGRAVLHADHLAEVQRLQEQVRLLQEYIDTTAGCSVCLKSRAALAQTAPGEQR